MREREYKAKLKNPNGHAGLSELREAAGEAKMLDSSSFEDFEQEYAYMSTQFADVEKMMRSGDYYTESGRVAYIDPRVLPVRPFVPSECYPDSSWCFVGKRRTGMFVRPGCIVYAEKHFYIIEERQGRHLLHNGC
jgi:hypothetical protein